MDYNINGRIAGRNGNRADSDAPHVAYSCAGENQWCAIAVETEEQWQGFKKVLGDPAWTQDIRFGPVTGRLEYSDESDQLDSSWTADLAPKDVMDRIQKEGVPSGVVQRSSDLAQDP